MRNDSLIPSAYDHQRLVAAMVTEIVVDRLEVVGVDDEHRAMLSAAHAIEVAFDLRRERAAGQAGSQAVGGGDHAELVIGDRQFAKLEGQIGEQGTRQNDRNDDGADHAGPDRGGRDGAEEEIVEGDGDGDAAEGAEDCPAGQFEPTAQRDTEKPHGHRPPPSPATLVALR
ncbi:MAG: hypothetical protein Q8Q62_17550 [Mesorhizobium sp.]|nr:hypothetical protein [Mesorhizobium sp.]